MKAAFPSLSQKLHSAPCESWELTRALLLPYGPCMTVADVLSSPRGGGTLSGVRQRCPSSGKAFALVSDPIIRYLAKSNPLIDMRLFCYADDIAAVIRHLMKQLPSLIHAFGIVSLATCLWLNGQKIVEVHLSGSAILV
mmetsp:Transcript_174682/g.560229  ORF Transcript_174682/g.560229 Transcript_174682/m.560229 type:complete len:139 (-) Transcript_174682:162-578(-)